jgi:hypothetical protein
MPVMGCPSPAFRHSRIKERLTYLGVYPVDDKIKEQIK